jgi:hypothetical protein
MNFFSDVWWVFSTFSVFSDFHNLVLNQMLCRYCLEILSGGWPTNGQNPSHPSLMHMSSIIRLSLIWYYYIIAQPTIYYNRKWHISMGIPTFRASRLSFHGIPTFRASRLSVQGIPIFRASRLSVQVIPTFRASRSSVQGIPISRASRYVYMYDEWQPYLFNII